MRLLRLNKVIREEIDNFAGREMKRNEEFAWDIQETFDDQAVRACVATVVNAVLNDYTDWLVSEGYADSDVYAEGPTAVNRYSDAKVSK